MNSAGSVGRRVLLIAVGLAALVVLFAGAPSNEASAQAAATNTPAATATPTFQWVVPDLKDPRNRLHVDPFQKRFRVDYVDENNRVVQGTPISVPSMQKTSRQVTFKYTDSTRPCETPTPIVPGGVSVYKTPLPRCPMYVWATLDRQRQDVRTTIFRRTYGGHTTRYVNNRPTPLALPVAPDPAVAISNFQLVPKRRIIQATEQLSFQNNTTLPCTIQFNSVRPPGQVPANPNDFDLGIIPPGQVARPFPGLLPTATATVSPEGTPPPKPDIWRPGEHLYSGSCGAIRLSGSIVVPD